jgi:hypothetical protein
LILTSEMQLDVGAILTLAGGSEHRLGIVVEAVVSQAASRKGSGRLCYLAED